MNMRYFRQPITQDVYGYDDDYINDEPYIERCIEEGWEEITGNWPEPVVVVEVTQTNDQVAVGG